MQTTALDTFTLVTLLILVVAVPLLGVWDYRRLINWDREGRPDARLKAYRFILVTEWALTLVLAAGWVASGRNLEALRFISAYRGWQWLAVGLGLAAVVFMFWQLSTVLRRAEDREKLRSSMGDLRTLAPRTAGEQKLFAAVSITAGICEEILYRGILLGALTPALGLWPAVALSTAIFGLGHVYQGLEGIVKTTLVGLVMALLTVFSGSLLIAVILHAVIDLVSGRMMGAALADEDPVSTAPAPAALPSQG